eukprot:GFUD01052733.1.p1 GENE.GFUD01052733.1~~GFUD01052733.1.p1  ORF type:complete len:316 (+),score=84.28 GFUD01052733.1:92-1039(+)
MAKATKEVMQSFDCLVTAVAMDEKFMLVGQEDGNVACYWWNGGLFFEQQISESMITAVCCEEEDKGTNHIFYAADMDGKLYTLDKKGNVLAKGKGRPDRIHTLLNVGKFKVCAYSETGYSEFSNATKKIKASESSTATANYSLDGDGTFYFHDQGGQYHVNIYNCDAATTAIATCALKVKKDAVFAFAVVDPVYFDDLATAEDCLLPVYDNDNKIIRKLEFEAPVIQVMSRKTHTEYPKNEIYFLLRSNTVVCMSGKDIENKSIKTKDLMENADRLEIDVDDEEFIKGFAVHGSKNGTKFCFQGLTEIFAISPDE